MYKSHTVGGVGGQGGGSKPGYENNTLQMQQGEKTSKWRDAESL